MNVPALHLAQQLSSFLRLRHENHRAHQLAHHCNLGFFIGNLNHILSEHHPLYLIDSGHIDRHPRMRPFAQHHSKFFDSGISGHGKDIGTRCHHLAHGFVAEFDHRLNQLAVTLFQDALFLSGSDHSVYAFCPTLGFFPFPPPPPPRHRHPPPSPPPPRPPPLPP